MSTTADSRFGSDDCYDPDDVVPRNSPLLTPLRPVFSHEPSPPASFPVQDVVVGSSPRRGKRRSRGRMKDLRRAQPSPGDVVLLEHLGGGETPEIPQRAGVEALPYDTDDEEMPPRPTSHSPHAPLGDAAPLDLHHDAPLKDTDLALADHGGDVPDPPSKMDGTLQSLAAGALAFATTDPPATAATAATAGPTPPNTEHDVAKERPPVPLQPPTFRDVSYKDADRAHGGAAAPSPFTPASLCSPQEGLPPIVRSPRSEVNGNTPLPSIRVQLADLQYLEHPHAADAWPKTQRHPAAFTHSPPATMSRMGSLSQISQVSQGSPPRSPNDQSLRREPPSPAYPEAPMGLRSPPFHYNRNAFQQSPEAPAPAPAMTPQSDPSGPTPAPPVLDRDHALGIYVCTYPGCHAQPFQTQYLLNSHTNVHSSIRPHYCPVKGCPRSEGGRGFKRKNEMIRHGLVHDSPGYVCPFCPDREHKYPRPDNLQRHVRVHHTDKDKDDPLLREILAQRSDGPSRGRRRRNAQSA
ncbi:hypothetical protein P8C59_005085 [Phyllachora maydis]|uniref:C2H2-type domain-containing protein n=1 Tax=Phyllachora maydis TaxID=1825666 RepID=A0AAD9I459_9PEZI|nr:hypothetical protein P8C59_005085 [Phyllachora maydis]